MPRPSPEERKRRDARREANAKLRAAEAKINARVQSMIDGALDRSRGRKEIPDMPELLQKLEEARELSMLTRQPMAAIAATLAQARLLGMLGPVLS